jgi:hypothetical protein
MQHPTLKQASRSGRGPVAPEAQEDAACGPGQCAVRIGDKHIAYTWRHKGPGYMLVLLYLRSRSSCDLS